MPAPEASGSDAQPLAAGSAPYHVDDTRELISPALLIFRDLVQQNVEAMIGLARDPERLRPHVKTHKMPALVRMLESMGIHKHKCATIAEAEMVSASGGRDVLLAYPLVGPNIGRMARLVTAYPDTTFRATIDDADMTQALSDAVMARGARPLSVLIDLDIGTGRTGIAPERADALARHAATLPGLALDGLHAYDGHVHETDLEARRQNARRGLEAVLALRDRLRAEAIDLPRLVLGGTPTFPIHAALDEPGVECSPGTCVLHDANYARAFPDLPFTPAAALLTRIISRPRPGRLCLDLGYKAVASDSPAASRLRLLDLPDATVVVQNEEHLVIESAQADAYPVGRPLLALPGHICPTSALHRQAHVIADGRVVGEWTVAARDRMLGV